MEIILVLFIISRLTILFLYSPQGLFSAYTDYYHYYRTAQLSEQGYFPFVNMWYEYPPLSAYIPQAAYWLTRLVLPSGDVYSFSYQFFVRVLGVMLLVFEVGVLILVYRIAERVWGHEKAIWLAWVYSALSLPLFFWTYAHQVVASFFVLLALYWFIEHKPGWSAVALGLGVAAKLTPAIFLASVVRFLWPQRRQIITYGVVTTLTALSTYLPFVLLGGGPWIVASFIALTKVGSYGTIWAILDKNWGPGTYGPLETRLQIEQASITQANPAIIPGIVVLAVFAVLYAVLFFRPIQGQNDRHLIWFTTLTSMVFHLWSKGWSPQWAVMIVPLLLLSFPGRRGVFLTLLLTGLVFIPWPISAVLTSNPLSAVFFVLHALFFAAVGVLAGRELWSG